MPTPMPLGFNFDIIEGIPPVDLQTGTAGLRTGDWVSLKNARGVMFLMHKGLGTAGDDPTLTFSQATSNAGAGSKAINPSTSPNHCFKKQALVNLSGTTPWSSAAADISTNTWTNTDSAEQVLQLAIWFDASEFDIANGFYFFSVLCSDVGGNAQPGGFQYILMLDYPAAPTGLISALG